MNATNEVVRLMPHSVASKWQLESNTDKLGDFCLVVSATFQCYYRLGELYMYELYSDDFDY